MGTKQRWPKIPAAELEASAVDVGTGGASCLVLLHNRRVSAAAAQGVEPVGVCRDCHRAFSSKKPRLCKFALAKDLWLGRIDPLLWDMTREMCLAAGDGGNQGGPASRWCPSGTASVFFHKSDAKYALRSLPPEVE